MSTFAPMPPMWKILGLDTPPTAADRMIPMPPMNRDLELIIAHLIGLHDSGVPLDPDVRNALVHERYTDAARLIRSGP